MEYPLALDWGFCADYLKAKKPLASGELARPALRPVKHWVYKAYTFPDFSKSSVSSLGGNPFENGEIIFTEMFFCLGCCHWGRWNGRRRGIALVGGLGLLLC